MNQLKEDITNLVLIAVIILLLDAVYLTFITRFFSTMIKEIQKSDMKVKAFPAGIAYLILTVVLYFVLLRDNQPIWKASLLGLAIYGVYDATNMATISGWNPRFAMIDTLWGVVCFTSTSAIYYYIKSLLG